MRALVLDDDAAIGRLVRQIAGAVGFVTELTTEAPEFRSRFDAEAPDVIVLDLQIGDADGVEQLRFLAGKAYRNPLILMSGFDHRVLATTERLARGLGLNPVAALTKPVRAQQLTQILNDVKSSLQPLSTERLFEAIHGDELVLEYQPIVNRERTTVQCLEALVRWNHPVLGRLPPDRFIPLAEQAVDVIDALTYWVVATAAQEYARLRELGLAAPMAVNVSGKNLHDLTFPDRVHDRLRQAKIPANHLCIEITENAAALDPAHTMDILSRLRLKGMKVALDDFGTGYSSLKQLRQLPFSALKIDRSFVADMTTSSDARSIVKSTIDLARNMDLQSIAEGVETEEAAVLLASQGVNSLQGYLIARPLPSQQLVDWLREWPSGPGAARSAAG